MSLEDQELINQILNQNDQQAYAELVHKYQSRLRYSLRQLTGWDETLADDLAQETFIKAFTKLQTFKGKSKFYSWIYSIAYRVLASHYRLTSTQQALETKPLSELLTQDMLEPFTTINDNTLHKDFAKALTHFPCNQATALHLHLHCELSHQDIANIMSLPLGTIKSHIQRGKNQLKVLLSDWQESPSSTGAQR